jgi:segregation and condensation protein B
MSKRKKQQRREQAAGPEAEGDTQVSETADADADEESGDEAATIEAAAPADENAGAEAVEATVEDAVESTVEATVEDDVTAPLASASVEEMDAAVDAALGPIGSGPLDDSAAPVEAADASESDAKTPPVEVDAHAMNMRAASGEETMEVSIDAPAAGDEGGGWGEEPTRVGAEAEMAELAAQSVAEPSGGHGAEGGDAEVPAVDSAARLESILESLIFASDRPLALLDFKRLIGERDAKKLTVALEAVQARHRGTGIELASTAGGWQFRTSAENAAWVAKLVAGRPARLSRAMLETLAIVAYRQPITRPEIDEIRGVDCGPVLKTLLDRALIRMIGKKEEVGRPILYGTTPEFLRTFSLKDLTELPTLRQFHELGAAEQAKVDAEAPLPAGEAGASGAPAPRVMPAPSPLPDQDPDEEDALLAELDEATTAATRATRSPDPPPPPPGDEPAPQATE